MPTAGPRSTVGRVTAGAGRRGLRAAASVGRAGAGQRQGRRSGRPSGSASAQREARRPAGPAASPRRGPAAACRPARRPSRAGPADELPDRPDESTSEQSTRPDQPGGAEDQEHPGRAELAFEERRPRGRRGSRRCRPAGCGRRPGTNLLDQGRGRPRAPGRSRAAGARSRGPCRRRNRSRSTTASAEQDAGTTTSPAPGRARWASVAPTGPHGLAGGALAGSAAEPGGVGRVVAGQAQGQEHPGEQAGPTPGRSAPVAVGRASDQPRRIARAAGPGSPPRPRAGTRHPDSSSCDRPARAASFRASSPQSAGSRPAAAILTAG